MEKSIQASRDIFRVAKALFAGRDYIYDPDHKKRPEGGGWEKTEKGWTKKKREKKDEGAGGSKTPKESPEESKRKKENLQKTGNAEGLTIEPGNKEDLQKYENFLIGKEKELEDTAKEPGSFFNEVGYVKYGFDTPCLLFGNNGDAESKEDDLYEDGFATLFLGDRGKDGKRKWTFQANFPDGETEDGSDFDSFDEAFEALKSNIPEMEEKHGLDNRKKPGSESKKPAPKEEPKTTGEGGEDKKPTQDEHDLKTARESQNQGTLNSLSGSPSRRVRIEVAKNPRTLPSTLERMAKDNDPEVKKAVAGSPNTSLVTLNELAGSNYDSVREAVASNRNTSIFKLGTLADDKAVSVREAVANNPSAVWRTLDRLSQSRDYTVRVGVARNPNASKETLERLARDPKEGVRVGVASNPSALEKTLWGLYESDGSEELRYSLAGNPNAPTEMLHSMAIHDNRHIQAVVANNSRTLPETLKSLASSSSEEVRERVARNPNTSEETLRSLTGDKDPVAATAAKVMSGYYLNGVRKEVIVDAVKQEKKDAEAYAKDSLYYGMLPSEIACAVSSRLDNYPLQSYTMLLDHKKELSPDDMRKAMVISRSHLYRGSLVSLALANRHDVSGEQLDDIFRRCDNDQPDTYWNGDDKWEIRYACARNPNFSNESIGAFLDKMEEEDDYHNGFVMGLTVRKKRLPIELQRKLAKLVVKNDPQAGDRLRAAFKTGALSPSLIVDAFKTGNYTPDSALNNKAALKADAIAFKGTLGPRGRGRTVEELKRDFVQHMSPDSYSSPEAFNNAKKRIMAMTPDKFNAMMAAITGEDEEMEAEAKRLLG